MLAIVARVRIPSMDDSASSAGGLIPGSDSVGTVSVLYQLESPLPYHVRLAERTRLQQDVVGIEHRHMESSQGC